MDILSEFLNPGIGFLLTLVFGFWVGKAGKPYDGILFNIHKLIALGTVIVSALQIYRIVKSSDGQGMIIPLIVISAISVVALFASGAFMSIGKVNYRFLKSIHNITAVLAVIAMGMLIYFLNGRAL